MVVGDVVIVAVAAVVVAVVVVVVAAAVVVEVVKHSCHHVRVEVVAVVVVQSPQAPMLTKRERSPPLSRSVSTKSSPRLLPSGSH